MYIHQKIFINSHCKKQFETVLNMYPKCHITKMLIIQLSLTDLALMTPRLFSFVFPEKYASKPTSGVAA